MSIFATARFVLHLAISAAMIAITALVLLAPSRIPENTLWFMVALGLGGAVVLCGVAVIWPKDATIANDELARSSQQAGIVLGYWATFAVFVVFLASALAGQMDPRTAFYLLGFPLGAVPSIYMVVAFFRGRAG
ncbi:hypothetical protein [Oricola sp.]|uniref:hypothetical protein n=1 Tax=Oricola sp. TaxID=1979950 RepID=UPI003BAD5340